ncbi:Guanine nucleotide exchange factor subunit Rich [Orchesella cincta]|uniref:Protein RIC1 homolog n=1 Tax=Orchesella cincta TaxID=48709 RepID=A0A1D2NEH6_ORCCI|nr:Guanine nucleotide exchange factor subunit Rich [Orchesella cincta]
MYFTFGWPKILRVPEADPVSPVAKIVANRDKIFFAVLTHTSLSVWTSKPCLPVVCHQRSQSSVQKLGPNTCLVWKPDSTSIVVTTSGGYLLFFALGGGSVSLYEQKDPDNPKLRRESDELFLKEPIPAINLQLVQVVAVRGRVIGGITQFRDELMVSTDENHILRYRWDGTVNTDFCIDLRRIPFSTDQQVSRAVPIQESGVYPVDFHYSPLIGGFSLVLSDGRAAFLTATTKVYDPNSVQGIWAPNLDDATCSSVNHKYRLLSFGRKNAETSVFSVDDQTGGLQALFHLKLSSKDFPGSPGAVKSMAWTPDGCAIAIAWEKGGFALWSVFGSLLTCSWSWTGDLSPFSQKIVRSVDWAAEGYQLWMAVESNPCNLATSSSNSSETKSRSTSLAEISLSAGLFGIISFVKSALTVNPAMSQIEHLYLQGEDRLLISFSGDSMTTTGNRGGLGSTASSKSANKNKTAELLAPLGNNKNWVVVPVPNTYLASNWPIHYTAMDSEGLHVAVSGRYGLAHYSIVERKWKLFGNEAQERDFVVVGGMMWWGAYLVVAVYDIAQDRDELRFYPRDSKLDNRFAHVKRLPSQILLLNLDRDKLLVFATDATLAIFQLRPDLNSDNMTTSIDPCECLQTIDISALCVHPACVISVYLTTLRTSFSPAADQQHSVVINVSGRLMILHHEFLVQENHQGNVPQYITPTVLASCVEMVWLPRVCGPSSVAPQQTSNGSFNSDLVSRESQQHYNHNPYLSEALWLYCGQEMRVWLPLREKSQSSVHTFISSRIMLGFPVSIYPLTILFEKAIILGAENDCLSYTTGGPGSPDPYGAPSAIFPFCILQRTSQVYLHQILRQLIRRNLGYYAWEIARSCSKLPYFPHSLELLLHEVLEEEATSKEPIPDALLPSIIEFVREFPAYLRAVGQCARKTELALWPHLFSVAGRPRALFDECLQRGQLDIAATYLLVIQNLESPTVSRKFATQLMDKALEGRKWDLVKDLVRFLKAIDPSDVEPVRSSVVKFNMQTPPVSPSEYDISMVLGTMQVPRHRSLSTSVVPKFPELSHRELSRTSSEDKSSPPLSSRQSTVANATSNSGASSSSPASHSPGSANPATSTTTNHSVSGPATGNANETSYSVTQHSSVLPPSGMMTDLGDGTNLKVIGAAYVDAIVERHARRILSEGKLRDLGRLAAHLDFHLVSWLRKEKRRKPLMVSDFVSALKVIHTEFDWPYPDFISPITHHSRTPSADSLKFSSPEAVSPVRPLTVDHIANRYLNSKKGADSGYNSTPGNHIDGNGTAVEARLAPNTLPLDDTLSVMSEESIMLDQSPISQTDFLPMYGLSDSAKISMLNSTKSGIELRFIQQILWEAGVLDWSLIVSIALRDALGAVRTVNSCRDQPPDVIRNLRDGLMNLTLWANTQCLGYKVFVTAVNGQVSGLLSKYLAAAAQNYAASSTSPTSPTPVTGVPGPHVGDLQRRKTEPALTNRSRIVSQHSSIPLASSPDTATTNGLRRPSKVLAPRASIEGVVSNNSISNDIDAVSTDGTEETDVEYGKAEIGSASCSSGASAESKNKIQGEMNNSNNTVVNNSMNEEVADGQGCVIM